MLLYLTRMVIRHRSLEVMVPCIQVLEAIIQLGHEAFQPHPQESLLVRKLFRLASGALVMLTGNMLPCRMRMGRLPKYTEVMVLCIRVLEMITQRGPKSLLRTIHSR